MVTAAVLGHRGMLGSVVARYLREWGASVATTDTREGIVEWARDSEYVIDCTGSAILPRLLAGRCRLIVPSTDAIREDSAYAAGKREVERLRAVVVRSGLVDYRRQLRVGFVDWLYDPLTPLEWAERAWAWRDAPGVHLAGRHVVDRWTVANFLSLYWGYPAPEPGHGGRLDRVVIGRGETWIGDAIAEFRAWLS